MLRLLSHGKVHALKVESCENFTQAEVSTLGIELFHKLMGSGNASDVSQIGSSRVTVAILVSFSPSRTY